MTFEDYIRARNEMTETNDYRYAISRHVAFRLLERYGVDQRSFRMPDWEKISYSCAIRRFPIFLKTPEASYFKVALDGQEIMWLYSRERRCVVTVVPMFDIDHYQRRYEDEYKFYKNFK